MQNANENLAFADLLALCAEKGISRPRSKAEALAALAAKQDEENEAASAAQAASEADDLRSKISAGVAASWKKPETRARRLTRNAVECDGVEYGSLFKAFCALGLPESKHIKFRVALKVSGAATFEHEGKAYAFRVLA